MIRWVEHDPMEILESVKICIVKAIDKATSSGYKLIMLIMVSKQLVSQIRGKQLLFRVNLLGLLFIMRLFGWMLEQVQFNLQKSRTKRDSSCLGWTEEQPLITLLCRFRSEVMLHADLLGSPVVRPADIETIALDAAYAAGVWTEEEIFSNGERMKKDTTFNPVLNEELRKKKVASWCKAVERTFDLADLSI
ncbi:hypothetical protein L6452_33549 [Arctium lappa]|uniref:Uncharacterized protein n=1 Tax=Arctium lappa TaxID=4217 RepID=A0ACB8YGV0_ARCLA|nr:hypothetical protein L6452_33549 [Arctium lappa]